MRRPYGARSERGRALMTARGATSWGHMSHDVAEVGIDPGEMTGPGRPSYLKTEAKHSISFQGSENKPNNNKQTKKSGGEMKYVRRGA